MLYWTRPIKCECRRCIFQHLLSFFVCFVNESRSEGIWLYQMGHLHEATLSNIEVSPAWRMKRDYMISRGLFQPAFFCGSNSSLALAQFCPTYFFLGSFFCLATESFFRHRQYQVLLNKSMCPHIGEGLHSQYTYTNSGSNLPCLQLTLFSHVPEKPFKYLP